MGTKRWIQSTSEYLIKIRKINDSANIVIERGGQTFEYTADYDEDDPFKEDHVIGADNVVKDIGRSIFFPTFRRIEGGFSLKPGQTRFSSVGTRLGKTPTGIEGALLELSERLTVGDHRFVAAISTNDVAQLLIRHYALMSEEANGAQKSLSDSIITQVRSYKADQSETSNLTQAETILREVQLKAEQMDAARTIAFAPFEAVISLVKKLFTHSGIRFSRNMSFGDAAEGVNSDALSAGEKQMLSFVCYNTFFRDGVFVVDEPELSLHVDWQRMLLPTLLSQHRTNQIIFSTHSPFIYSQYPDRELIINPDRGNRGSAEGEITDSQLT